MFENIPRETLTPKERGALYNAGKEVDHIPYSLLGTEAAAILYGMDIRKTYIDTETVIELEKKMVQDLLQYMESDVCAISLSGNQ